MALSSKAWDKHPLLWISLAFSLPARSDHMCCNAPSFSFIVCLVWQCVRPLCARQGEGGRKKKPSYGTLHPVRQCSKIISSNLSLFSFPPLLLQVVWEPTPCSLLPAPLMLGAINSFTGMCSSSAWPPHCFLLTRGDPRLACGYSCSSRGLLSESWWLLHCAILRQVMCFTEERTALPDL